MTDEIFDYFGGNSARKVEPLDESELFDDLKPAAAESKSAAENQNVDLEEVEVEIVEESDDAIDSKAVPPTVTQGNATVDETSKSSGSDISHWDFLANSLGINPPPQAPKAPVSTSPAPAAGRFKGKRPKPEKKPSPPPVPFGTGIYDAGPVEPPALSRREEPTNDDPSYESQPQQTEDFFEFETKAKSADDSTNENVLSELFVPSDEEYGPESTEIVDVDFGDEILGELADGDTEGFAGFSAGEAHGAPIEEGEDFVEFEVTDLEESPERGPRRRRRRPRGLSAEPARRESRDNRSKSSNRDQTERVDGVNKDDAERSNRRGRPRRSRSDEDYAEPNVETDREFDDKDRVSEDRDQRPTRSEGTGRRRRRGRRTTQRTDSESAGYDQDKSLVDDEDSGGEDKKRKPTIPTWDDAIGSMIESNIQRHKSGSGNRGGRRRR